MWLVSGGEPFYDNDRVDNSLGIRLPCESDKYDNTVMLRFHLPSSDRCSLCLLSGGEPLGAAGRGVSPVPDGPLLTALRVAAEHPAHQRGSVVVHPLPLYLPRPPEQEAGRGRRGRRLAGQFRHARAARSALGLHNRNYSR